jgi:phosphoacetylglucosamine mutase
MPRRLNPKQKQSHSVLKALPALINQTGMFLSRCMLIVVGDALSDMLMVEAILVYRQWSIKEWLANTYSDLPNRQLKVRVKDRAVCKTEDADRRVASPEGFQSYVDAAISAIPQGRGFVRYSITIFSHLKQVRREPRM